MIKSQGPEAGPEEGSDLHDDITQKTFEETLENERVKTLLHHFLSHLDELRQQQQRPIV